ncbi:MAG: hypothetical protein CL608_04990 [Anaerolineaceae bacterium]|nr:hypothetical protein [Anaerolineaceae bacterium]
MFVIDCSIGITAYNEAANIGNLLQRILDQRLETVAIQEIIVVASGCTDSTEAIVREFAARDGRIRLLVQPKREGKASAMNLFIREAANEVMILCSADLQPDAKAVEQLIAPFADPEVGMSGCHPVPVNDPETFMGFAVHLQWNLHHALNMSGGFKGGEMVGFRRLFARIPYHTAVDEASVEPIVRGQGYKVQYCPEAIVYNKGPETVADFLRQRRRIYAGHLDLANLLGYKVSTMSGGNIAGLLLKNLDWRPKQLIWTVAVIGLEIYGRFLGKRDFKNRKNHTIWEIATTTKELS